MNVSRFEFVRGPSLWTVPGADLLLAASLAAGSPSVSPDVTWRFPKSAFVDGVLVMLRPDPVLSLDEQFATTALRIIDETNQPIVSDSRGGLRGATNAPVAAPLLLMHGFGFRQIAVQRPVYAQDRWIFSFQNSALTTTQVAGIFIFFKDARR